MTFPAEEHPAPGPAGRMRAVRAIVWRDYLITRSYRFSLLTDILFGLVNLAIYYYISRTVGHTAHDLGGAPSYFAFAAVGVAVMVVVQSASVGLARRLREEQLSGTLEMLAAQPIAAAETSLGLAGFPFLFAMFRGAIYLAAAFALVGPSLPEANLPAFALIFVLTGFAVAAIGVAVGAVLITFKRGDTLALSMLFVLGMAGGAYFPTSVLPSVLQPIVDLVPTRFAFDGLRNALFNGTGWAGDALALAAFGCVGLPLAILVFETSLRHARARGTLAQY